MVAACSRYDGFGANACAQRGRAPLPAECPVRRRDPLAHPEPLIHRVYGYAAYRLGNGPDAEDVTGEVFERALRYRHSFDESRGSPEQWLIGIARRCVDDALSTRRNAPS